LKNRLPEKHSTVVLFLSLLFVSCAAKLPYSFDYPLTNETFFSRDGSFYGLVPQGWFASTGDTLAPALSAWLVKEDFSAVLTLRELQLDQLSSNRVEIEGLELLANISVATHNGDSSITELVIPPKEYTMHDRKYCGYEVHNGDRQERIVVFSAKGRYYESEAIQLQGRWQRDETMKLFMAQQALLFSIVY